MRTKQSRDSIERRSEVGTFAGPNFSAADPEAVDLRPQFEVTIVDAVKAAWDRKFLISTITAAMIGLALAISFVVPKTYVGEALVLLSFGGDRGGTAPGIEASAIVKSEADIIRSNATARRVADAITSDPSTLNGAPPVEGLAPNTPPQVRDRAIIGLQKTLKVQDTDTSYLVKVSYSDSDPVRAAAIANSFANEYIDSRIETTIEETRRKSDWLSERIALAEDRLALREAEAAQFGRNTGLLLDGQGPSARETQLARTQDQLANARLERIRLESQRERIEAAIESENRSSSEDVIGSNVAGVLIRAELDARQEVERLRQTLNAGHPILERAETRLANARTQIDEALQDALNSTIAQIRGLSSAEAALNADVATLESELRSTLADDVTAQRLSAATVTARQELDQLRAQFQEANALSSLPPINAVLVSSAEPMFVPVWPSLKVFGALGLVLGVIVSAGTVVLINMRDVGFSTEREVEENLGLYCAGVLPNETRHRRDASTTERAVTQLATRIMLGPSSVNAAVYVVTSSVPGERVLDVAKAVANRGRDAGKRAVVVATEPPAPARKKAPARAYHGLAGFLARLLTGEREDNTRTDAEEGVLRVSPETLSQTFDSVESLDQWVFENANDCDMIVVALPPILSSPEAEKAARLADLIVFAVGWRSTPAWVARAAIRQLGIMARGRWIAAVLTGVDLNRHRRLGQRDSLYLLERYAPNLSSKSGHA